MVILMDRNSWKVVFKISKKVFLKGLKMLKRNNKNYNKSAINSSAKTSSF